VVQEMTAMKQSREEKMEDKSVLDGSSGGEIE
jgi:hypothetical protein